MEKSKNYRQEEENILNYFSRALKFSFLFLKLLVGALVVYYFLFSGFFMVKQDEIALVLRWGRITGVGTERVLQPGFHWAFPEPIDKVIRIPVKSVKTYSLDQFWSDELNADNPSPMEFLTPYLHGYCITGDNNIIHTLWAVDYLIEDPILYITRVENEEKLIADVLCNAVIEAVGSFNVDEALRTQLERISRRVRYKAQAYLNSMETGITITGVYLNRSVPPLQTANAFNSVIQAEQTKDSQIKEAESYSTRVINAARGEASQILSSAQTYKNEVVNEAFADAQYINELTARFKQGSKELNTYLSYFYQEKIQDIFSHLPDKFILQKPLSGRDNELRIILGEQKKWEGAK
jgi:modulator of FtsH protease HflK